MLGNYRLEIAEDTARDKMMLWIWDGRGSVYLYVYVIRSSWGNKRVISTSVSLAISHATRATKAQTAVSLEKMPLGDSKPGQVGIVNPDINVAHSSYILHQRLK